MTQVENSDIKAAADKLVDEEQVEWLIATLRDTARHQVAGEAADWYIEKWLRSISDLGSNPVNRFDLWLKHVAHNVEQLKKVPEGIRQYHTVHLDPANKIVKATQTDDQAFLVWYQPLDRGGTYSLEKWEYERGQWFLRACL